MTALSVNLNKIALIRNSRDTTIPDLIIAANTVVVAGADGITIHPRPDQRHIRVSDVYHLNDYIRSQRESNPSLEYNIEGNPFSLRNKDYPGFLPLVFDTLPNQCTLVPDSNDQLTSDHGWDLLVNGDKLRPIIDQLKNSGIRVSLFMDPDLDQIKQARELGADRIELYTGPYAAECLTAHPVHLQTIKQQYQAASELAHELGLGLNAGHDLNLENLPWIIKNIVSLDEVSIGHALVNDALYIGLSETVLRYKSLLNE